MDCYILYYAITLTTLTNAASVSAIQYGEKTKGDKLTLDPVDLINMIMEERRRNHIPDHSHFIAYTEAPNNRKRDFKISGTRNHNDIRDDTEALKMRKMWSRWNKWSECSVTCGEGSTVRTRTCVAGRCAPNEREEQHRPCSRPPCLNDNTDELHDFD